MALTPRHRPTARWAPRTRKADAPRAPAASVTRDGAPYSRSIGDADGSIIATIMTAHIAQA